MQIYLTRPAQKDLDRLPNKEISRGSIPCQFKETQIWKRHLQNSYW